MDHRLQDLHGLANRPGNRWRELGWWGRPPLWQRVERIAAAQPDKPAVIDDEHVLSYGNLWSAALATAAATRHAGVSRGDIVLVQLPNWHEFATLAVAAEIAGAVFAFCPIQWGVRETVRALRLIRPKLWFTSCVPRPDEDRSALISEALQSVGREAPLTIVLRSAELDGTERLENWLAQVARPLDRNRFESGSGSHPLEIAVTSGSTGDPKGVLHVHDSAIIAIDSTIERQGITGFDIIHLAVPVGHTFGYFYGVRCAFQAGGTLLLQGRWDADLMCDLVRKHRATVSLGPSAFLIDLLALGKAAAPALRSLRLFTHGGDSLPAPLVRNLMEVMPFRISRAFGMTEFGHVCATDADASIDQTLHTLGTPQPEIQVRIRNDRGNDVAPGVEGSIVVSGPFLFAGYLTEESLNQDVLDPGGFFETGDLGMLDHDGCLRITGRVKNVIRRGAETIPVGLLEEVIASHPAVIHAVVVGIMDARLGEVPVACVQMKAGCSLSMIDIRRLFESQKITKKFWPRGLHVFEHWPLAATGKIDRRLIAEEVQARSRRRLRNTTASVQS
jgi:cyclohexanecarboxylate-CoA ligase